MLGSVVAAVLERRNHNSISPGVLINLKDSPYTELMVRTKQKLPKPAELERIEEFVRVVRRVKAHPLVQDVPLIPKLASQSMTVNVTGQGQVHSIDLVRVDEVILESWALRTRRLESKDDPVYFNSIMKLIKSQISKRGQEDHQEAEHFEQLRIEWNEFQNTPAFITNVTNIKTGEEQSATSLEIVDAWRNGHMFHGDLDKKDRPELMTPNEMVLQVGHHLARVTLHAVAALHALTQCHNRGLISLDPSCFDDQVVYDKEQKVMGGVGQVTVVGPRVEWPEPAESD